MLVKGRELSVTRCKDLHTPRKAASRAYDYLRPIVDVMSLAGIGVSMYIRFCGKKRTISFLTVRLVPKVRNRFVS